MANLTANREDVQSLLSTDSITMLGTAASASWYRGSAIAYLNDGASGIGEPSKTFDGTVPLAFMGVVKRKVDTDSNSAGYQLGIPLKRDGAVSFNLVNSDASAPETATSAHLGRPVFFRSDNEVSLTPPSGKYPTYAGRVIGISSMVGCEGLSTTQVLVEIEGAVRGYGPQWAMMSFGVDLTSFNEGTMVLVAKTTTGLVTARRIWLGRMIGVITRAFAGATACTMRAYKNNSALGSSTTDFSAVTAGVTVNGDLYTAMDYNDMFGLEITTTGNATAGGVQILVEYMPLQ